MFVRRNFDLIDEQNVNFFFFFFVGKKKHQRNGQLSLARVYRKFEMYFFFFSTFALIYFNFFKKKFFLDKLSPMIALCWSVLSQASMIQLLPNCVYASIYISNLDICGLLFIFCKFLSVFSSALIG